MKKLLLIIASLIALTSAMRDWQFNIPPRLFIYDVMTILFIVVWLLYYSIRSKKVLLNNELKTFLLIVWAYFAIEILSGTNIIFIYDSQESFVQYFKAILSNGVFAIFASLFCMFMSELEPKARNQILACFIAGVVLSSLYGVMGIILFKSHGLRIEAVFWDYLSYNTGPRFDESLTWTVMSIRRGVGFPGVTAGATYNMTILPLLLLYFLYRGRLKDYLLFPICFVGLVITISLTGFIGFTVSLVVLFALSFKDMKSAVFRLLIIAFPFITMGYMWWVNITEIAQYRRLSDITRKMMWESGLQLFFDNPLLGIGTNNFSVVRETLASQYYHEANLHNSWLTILVELGIVGLVCYVAFFLFIIRKASSRNNLLSKGLICSLVGLSVSGLGNQLFDLFYFKFFIILVFSMVALGDGQFLNAERYRNPQKPKPLASPSSA